MEPLNQKEFIAIALLALLITLWFYWLWTRRSFYRFAWTHPGYFDAPILGCFPRFMNVANVFPAMTKIFQESKCYTLCVWLGVHPVLLTSDPNFIELIVTNPLLLNKAKCMYEPMHDILGGGLLCSETEKWQHNRKLVNPSFRHKVLLSFLPIFYEAKNRMQHEFDAIVGSGEHKIRHMIDRIICGTAIETTMGKTMHEDNSVAELANSLFYVKKKVVEHVLLAFLNLSGLRMLYIRFRKSQDFINDFIKRLIISKLDGTVNGNNTSKPQTQSISALESENELLAIKKSPKIFIDQAIEIYQKQQFSVQDIISESNTVVASAIETTANVIFSAIVMLAMHPEVQEKLYEEIVSFYPNKDVKMEYDHMQQLPYLNRVINETLRLAPSVPLIGRQVVQDTKLSKDVILPKGFQIVISMYHLHRRTDIWGPNADQFDPDRFLPEYMIDKHSYAFMPFSKGSRNCIGSHYAIFAINVMLSGILRNYRFSTSFKYEDIHYIDNVSITYLVEPSIQVHRR